MFRHIFAFEIGYHRRQFLFYILAGVFFLVSFLATTSPNVSMGANFGSSVNMNAPISVIITLATLSVLTMFGAIAFTSNGVVRDFDQKTAELFMSTRITKFDYLYGRFFGSFLFSFGIFIAGALGVFMGELAPWLDEERLGDMSIRAYLFAIMVYGLPNLFNTSCVFFCVATVTRSTMLTYVASIAFLMLAVVLSSFDEPETVEMVSRIEPFGLTALGEQIRYWTVFEKNAVVPALEGDLLINRLAWMTIGLAFLALAYVLFPFSVEAASLRRRAKKQPEEAESVAPQAELQLPRTNREFGLASNLHQLLSQTRMEVRHIVRGAPFIVLMLFGVLNVVGAAAGSISNMFGTSVYPTTGMMVQLINGSLSFSIMGVLMFYSGEIMLKERVAGFSEISDSLPYPNWVMMAAKLAGLILVLVMMMIAATLGAISVQVYNGYYEFDLPVYLQGLLLYFQFPFSFMCIMAVFFYVMTRSRYLTMFLVVVYCISLIALPQMGFQHHLYRFDTPGVPYSAFTGYTQLVGTHWWYSLYLALWGLLLIVATHLLWPRGSEFTLRSTLAVARQRLSPTVATVTALTFVALVSCGGYIYYNTNVLNDYMTTFDVEENQADYEKQYKQFQYLPQPVIRNVYAQVDIYPDEREVIVEGYYDIVNEHDHPVQEVHVTLTPTATLESLDLGGATLKQGSEKFGHYIYTLPAPLAPGEQQRMSFKTAWLTPGFKNNSASMKLTENGTFFNNLDVFPLIGYRQDAELQDPADRRKYDLPPIQRMRKIDDQAGRMISGIGGASRVDFEAIVSTRDDQIAMAPGYLQQQWTEDDRAYYHYRMDAPIWNFYSFISADYKTRKDTWNDVAIEVYYLHDYNVDRMIYATKKSFDYFTEHFTDYQYRQFRILEFPKYQGRFAQSFPNTIPFSESIGFVADLRDPKDIDYVYYVTAHELAHQWWAHQVLGAEVQGQTMLAETLSQYFALMVMKQEYGEDTMKKFLEYELDNYLQSRGGELIEELPIYLVEDQPYIHYNKGSVALYSLQDYIGEDTVNTALRNFLEKWGFKGAPYPTTLDLLAEIRAVAGPEHDALIADLFEKIVLFDLKVEEVAVTETPDGRFEVDIDVSLAKFEADGAGQETEVDITGRFDIALLGEKDSETDVYDVISIEKIAIDENSRRITIMSDTRPVSVGIDPFNKLIDRNPDDNIKAVES